MKNIVGFIFVLLPMLGICQEQVSNLKFSGLYSSTHLTNKIGFVKHNDNQYFVQDNDTLSIFKIVDGQFILVNVVPKFENQSLNNYSTFKPNRSYLNYENGKIFRTFEQGIQIINIEDGQLLFQYDFKNIGNVSFSGVHKDYIFFTHWDGKKTNSYSLNTKDQVVRLLDIPTDGGIFNEVDHQLVRIVDSKLHVFDMTTSIDTLIENLPNINRIISYSVQDSAYFLLTDSLKIIKLHQNLTIQPTPCTLAPYRNPNIHYVTNHRLFVFVRGIDTVMDTLFIKNIDSGFDEMSIIDEMIESDFTSIQFPKMADGNENFTIFTYIMPPGFPDVAPVGFYFLVDHDKKSYTSFKGSTYIQEYSSFVQNDKLYYIGISSSFWGDFYRFERLDLDTKESIIPFSNSNIQDFILGYHDDGILYLATNTEYENPLLHTMEPDGHINDIQKLDFSKNLGTNSINAVITTDERFYFRNHSGIYSTFKNTIPERQFKDPKTIIKYGSTLQQTKYKEYVAFGFIEDGKLKFIRINATNNKKDSVTIAASGVSDLIGVGPFILIDRSWDGTSVQYYDVRNNKMNVYSALKNISAARLVKSDNSALYYDQNTDAIFLIDYEKGTITKTHFTIPDIIIKASAVPDMYYLIQKSTNNPINFFLLDKDLKMTLVYQGMGYFSDLPYKRYLNSKDGTFSYFLINSQSASDKLLVCKQDETEVLDFSQDNSRYHNLVYAQDNVLLLNYYQGNELKHLLHLSFDKSISLDVVNARMSYMNATDSLVVMIFNVNNGSVIYKYDRIADQLTKTILSSIECNNMIVNDGIPFGENKHLLSVSCGHKLNLWILDMENDSVQLKSNISFARDEQGISDFFEFKNYIYFTAAQFADNRQWYRIKKDTTSALVESVFESGLILKVYPSPATKSVQLDVEAAQIELFNVNGHVELKTNDYHVGDAINIQSLTQGMHWVKAKLHDGRIATSNFVKME
jgi:hypothetical protein